jgi:ABC-type transport system involved in cytochrome c biogenesis permease subunit
MAMEGMEAPLVIPPAVAGGTWIRTGAAALEASIPATLLDYLTGRSTMSQAEASSLMARVGQTPLHPALNQFASMTVAYREGRFADLLKQVSAYRDSLPADFGRILGKTRGEQAFNQWAPFYRCMEIYLFAFLLVAGFWLTLSELPRQIGWWIILAGFFVHSAGLITRMQLEGRPPVTNLYSSAVFIGWGAVALGLILERVWRNGIGLAVGSVLGFGTLIIAHGLSKDGDTMEMMRAVLDTNFWLATHVVIVTLGYASTYVAGFLALLYVGLGLFTRVVTTDMAKSLSRAVYGILCFATLFSFVGTVLGGIWADQSWGRFWGWDPKENGALIIVLWNALILHARWGGLVRERGVMLLALVGNIVTSWSWFGTNMLGIGLHSYGFMDAAFLYLLAFVISQVVLIGLGLIPQTSWRSPIVGGTSGSGPGSGSRSNSPTKPGRPVTSTRPAAA